MVPTPVLRRTGGLLTQALAKVLLALGLLAGTASAGDLTPARCEALTAASLGPVATVTRADVVGRGMSADLGWAPQKLRPEIEQAALFCRVTLESHPGRSSRIGVEVWLPMSGWNGRLLGTGNGGYPLSVDYAALLHGLGGRYAVANTDLGLAGQMTIQGVPSPMADPSQLFVGHPTAIVDFASRATHEMTVLAKALVKAAYGRLPRHAYFVGCSTGGMQAFSEVERYPDDYDGVAAGAPGQNRTRVHLSILWDFLAVWHKPERVLTEDHLALLHAEVLHSCAKPGEAFLRNPQDCQWRPEALLCAVHAPPCLTQAQVDTAALLYDGPKNPRTGEQYMRGLPRGSEVGWSMYMRQVNGDIPYSGVFLAALGSPLRFEDFDWDRDAATFITTLGPSFDATDLNIRPFLRRGGKLLIYHGGADPLAPVADSVEFYHRMGSEVVDQATPKSRFNSSVRLFVLPGVGHCKGGDAPDQFEPEQVVEHWVESSAPPARLEVHSSDPSKPVELLLSTD